MLEFKAFDLWSCDVVDAMMFLAPDGSPPGSPNCREGQEAVFKRQVQRINRSAGSVELADQMIRERVFVDFIEMQQRRRKPFDCDAAVLVQLLIDLDLELISEK